MTLYFRNPTLYELVARPFIKLGWNKKLVESFPALVLGDAMDGLSWGSEDLVLGNWVQYLHSNKGNAGQVVVRLGYVKEVVKDLLKNKKDEKTFSEFWIVKNLTNNVLELAHLIGYIHFLIQYVPDRYGRLFIKNSYDKKEEQEYIEELTFFFLKNVCNAYSNNSITLSLQKLDFISDYQQLARIRILDLWIDSRGKGAIKADCLSVIKVVESMRASGLASVIELLSRLDKETYDDKESPYFSLQLNADLN